MALSRELFEVLDEEQRVEIAFKLMKPTGWFYHEDNGILPDGDRNKELFSYFNSFK